MRTILMCGGADEKWTERGGTGRRHFQVINGERVIDRLVRQLNERGVRDIGIVCPDLPGYGIDGTYRIAPRYTAWGHEALNTEAHASKAQRTITIYGDTVFTEAAMDTVVGFDPIAFQVFGRYGPGGVSRWGELFAVSFWPEQAGAWFGAVRKSLHMTARGTIRRGGSWEGMRILGGATGQRINMNSPYPALFTSIIDATDDFDDPVEFEALRLLHRPNPPASVAAVE